MVVRSGRKKEKKDAMVNIHPRESDEECGAKDQDDDSDEKKMKKMKKKEKKELRKETENDGKKKKLNKKRPREEADKSKIVEQQQQHLPESTNSKKRVRKEKHRESLKTIDDDDHEDVSINNKNDKNHATRIEKDDECGGSSTDRPFVESSALPTGQAPDPSHQCVTLLLFYQYVEPPWSESVYKSVQTQVLAIGKECHVTGRMRVAREGLNCTLTGVSRQDVLSFCQALRTWQPQTFAPTEFKLTHHLSTRAHLFGSLKIIPVTELVNYGLSLNTVNGKKSKTPPSMLEYSGTHLEPTEYHQKLTEANTVIIDVRNHYETNIGRFVPPNLRESSTVSNSNDDTTTGGNRAVFLDPKMRKSTEFPVWLDHPETKAQLEGKQVLMYCTGGIRCERASALLQHKMATDPTVAALNIKGVYQLQGGIDKYFKEFPNGGYWRGKNYTFDKRFSHEPVEIEELADTNETESETVTGVGNSAKSLPLSQCEACAKPWDKYRGKRRCPTCGVPSLICKECYQADQDGGRKLDRTIRCDLCVEQRVRSKKEWKLQEQSQLDSYERRLKELGSATHNRNNDDEGNSHDSNPNGVTRLYLRNMCRKHMTEDVLCQFLPDVTHVVWRTNGQTGQFFGQGWVEMKDAAAARAAVSQSGKLVILGRPLYMEYQPADGKDVWPPSKSAVVKPDHLNDKRRMIGGLFASKVT